MMKFRSCLLLAGLAASAWVAHGQAIPAATKGGALEVGFGLSEGTTDEYTTNGNVVGASAFVTFDLSEHLSAEADAHVMALNTPHDFVLDSYLIGPRYAWHYGRYTPYGKIMLGIGHASADSPYGTPIGVTLPLNTFAYAPGGGIDVEITPKWSARVDVEYQIWTGFPPNGLTPAVGTIGVGYHFK